MITADVLWTNGRITKAPNAVNDAGGSPRTARSLSRCRFSQIGQISGDYTASRRTGDADQIAMADVTNVP